MSLAAIIKDNGIFIGYTDDSENYVFENGTSLVSIDQTTLDQLIIDASTKSMQWSDNNWIVSDLIEDLKSEKIKEAIAYKESIDRFIVNSAACIISKKALRDLFVDIQIQKDDIAVNGGSACSQSFNIEGLTQGVLNNIPIASAEDIVLKVRCFKRTCESILKGHIDAINLLTTRIDIANYNIEDLYPTSPEIEY